MSPDLGLLPKRILLPILAPLLGRVFWSIDRESSPLSSTQSGEAKSMRRYGPIVRPSGGAIHQEDWKGTRNQDFNGQRPGSPDLGEPV